VHAAGGDFIGTPGKQTRSEEIFAADPDVIIAAWCGAGDRVPLEKIMQQRGWGSLTAVRAGRVFCINDEYLNTPGPTLLHGLHALATGFAAGAAFILSTIILNMVRVSLYGPESQPTWVQQNTRAIAFAAAFV